MVHSITEYLDQLQRLTATNLQILDTLNKSFHTNKEHLVATIGDEDYAVPSFLYLENKINTLQQDLENIVNAPKTGEAFTYFDGTTQRMQLAGYSTTPNSLKLVAPNIYESKTNNIFKDFLAPMPYVRMDIQSISNVTKTVNLKKVVVKNDVLWGNITGIAGENKQISYADFVRLAYVFNEGSDYIEYDTTRRLPFRAGGPEGHYNITNIVDDFIDSNFDEHYTVEVDSDLVYYKENGTFQFDLQIGDQLVTDDDKTILEIESMNPNTRTMMLKVLDGGYANLVVKPEDDTTLTEANYGLKFMSHENFNETKYVDVPLEEDIHICVFIAPINDTTNTQAPWGTGIAIDVEEDLEGGTSVNGIKFRDYYDKFVNNVGDILYSITSMMTNSATNLSEANIDALVAGVPTFNSEDLTVTQINKHLDDSATIQHIRELYDQKSSLKSDLAAVQKDIDDTIGVLSSISFDDTSNNRQLYSTRLSDLNARKKELTESINNTVNDIVREANTADVPIENAKYRIRGFLPIPEPAEMSDMTIDVIRIEVQYRYRNSSSYTGNAEVIGENIFTDWIVMQSPYKWKQVQYNNGAVRFEYDELNNQINEPSFNQIDIPINQGESVDIRARYIYDVGFPFAEMHSDWSEVLSVAFPDEYKTNITIVQIIEENNDDIKRGQFSAILDKNGVIDHCNDKLEDQDLTYFHQPQHIASGFYTPERRVVPLADKLREFSEEIMSLRAEVEGQQSDNLMVYISDSQSNITLQPYITNEFRTIGFNNNQDKISADLSNPSIADYLNTDVAYSQLNIGIYNSGDYELRLYSMFPGNPNATLTTTANSVYDAAKYVIDNTKGVWMQLDGDSTTETLQKYNQIAYFRVYDIFTDEILYNTNNPLGLDSTLIPANVGAVVANLTETECTGYYGALTPWSSFATLYPYVGQLSTICLDADQMFLTIKPGESVNIPLSFFYSFNPNNNSVQAMKVSRSIEFDLRTSLYKDPVPYRLKVSAYKNDAKSFTVKKIDNILRMGDTSKGVAYSPVINKKITSL